MLLSQKEKGYSGDSGNKNVRRVLRFCVGALCGLVLACCGILATAAPKPAPAPPQTTAQHSLTLTWTEVQGTDIATGFNIYRSTVTGGPFTKLTSAPLAVTVLTYQDTTGAGGTKYFYVVTAIDSLGVESANSAEVTATFIASSPNVPTNVTITAK